MLGNLMKDCVIGHDISFRRFLVFGLFVLSAGILVSFGIIEHGVSLVRSSFACVIREFSLIIVCVVLVLDVSLVWSPSACVCFFFCVIREFSLIIVCVFLVLLSYLTLSQLILVLLGIFYSESR